MKILRTIGILALVAGLLLGGAGSAFAQEPEPELAEIEGVIEAVDTEAGTVTILSEEGETVTLTIITGETEIKKDEELAYIEDLAKDDEVEALYNPGTLEAVKIVAKSPEPEETAEPAETEEPEENGGPAGGHPEPGPHSPGKCGLFGTVTSVAANVISLKTEEGTFTITRVDTTKYRVPGETHGPQLLASFLDIVDELEGRRLAVLVDLTNEFEADAIRLMLIPSSGSSPSWGHRVGIVQTFSEGSIITIKDKNGNDYTFDVSGTVYRPDTIAGLTGTDLIDALIDPITGAGGCVTVVTKGDPKTAAYTTAKAIVLHMVSGVKELPDWAP